MFFNEGQLNQKTNKKTENGFFKKIKTTSDNLLPGV